jgi:hypothetical protein
MKVGESLLAYEGLPRVILRARVLRSRSVIRCDSPMRDVAGQNSELRPKRVQKRVRGNNRNLAPLH